MTPHAHHDDPRHARLNQQATNLPRLYVELLEAVTDHAGVRGSNDTGNSRAKRKAADTWAAPLELDLSVFVFLTEPTINGELGLAESLLSMEHVTRLAYGDRKRQDATASEARVIAAAHYLARRAGDLTAGAAWTEEAARRVRVMHEDAAAGIDDEVLRDRWSDARADARKWLDGYTPDPVAEQWARGYELAPGLVELGAWLQEAALTETLVPDLAAVLTAQQARGCRAQLAEPFEEFYGRHQDAITSRYATAAYGPEQWADYVSEEVFRLHERARTLRGLCEIRSRETLKAPCPWCEEHSLILEGVGLAEDDCAHVPACGHGDPLLHVAGCDRRLVCGHSDELMVRCVICLKAWSLDVHPESMVGLSEFAVLSRAFVQAGWEPTCLTGDCRVCAACTGALLAAS